MRKCEHGSDPYDALGFFVEFASSVDGRVKYDLELISAYRIKLTIFLPPGQEDRAKAALQIFVDVERGCSWPLRFEYANLMRFLSIEELEKIEKRMPRVTFYVYGVPESKKAPSFDEDTLRRWQNAACRAAYVSGSRAGYKPASCFEPIEGQLAMDLG